MTTTIDTAVFADRWAEEETVRAQLLDQVQAIADELAATTQDSEEQCSLSDAAADLLRSNDFLRMKLPKEIGGLELSMASQMVVLEALARIDSGAGWVTMVSNTAAAFLGAFLSDEAVSEVFADGPNQTFAGVAQPSGKAVRQGKDYVVSGRWRLCSGIRQATWLEVASTVEGEPGRAPIMFAVPAADANILDTWHVMGLRGTGSCDFELNDVLVPGHRVFDVNFNAENGSQQRGGVMYSLPGLAFVAYEHTAMSLGMGRRALGRLGEVLRDRRAARPAGIPDREMVAAAVGRSTMALDAARGQALQIQRELFDAAQAGSLTKAHVARSRASGRFCTDIALEAARMAFQYGGAASLYTPNPLESALRDLTAASQHVGVSDVAYVDYGTEVTS